MSIIKRKRKRMKKRTRDSKNDTKIWHIRKGYEDNNLNIYKKNSNNI